MKQVEELFCLLCYFVILRFNFKFALGIQVEKKSTLFPLLTQKTNILATVHIVFQLDLQPSAHQLQQEYQS